MWQSRPARAFDRERSAAPTISAGWRLYVIGDIHGRLDLLNDLERQIKRDLESAPAHVLTIFLGDYVDRGGESAGVLDRLASDDFCTPICALRGNHEEVFLRFLEVPSVLASWRQFGGLETLHSYGVNVAEAMRGVGYEKAQEALASVLPSSHLQFLQGTRPSFEMGDYFFCHAGVRPGVSLDKQVSHDLLWIRSEFLNFEGSFEKIIVHGHTPVGQPDIKQNRINVDTGAYASSILTALVLEGESRRFLAANGRDE
jgi:serine/threonine protein phosphatase 1